MTEILNLNTLCRCCHVDGNIKSLQEQYVHDGTVEIYVEMLQETLGIFIPPPPVDVSYAICDKCITKLREAKCFRDQVISCENKFKVYCENEIALKANCMEFEVEFGSDETQVDHKPPLNDDIHVVENFNSEVIDGNQAEHVLPSVKDDIHFINDLPPVVSDGNQAGLLMPSLKDDIHFSNDFPPAVSEACDAQKEESIVSELNTNNVPKQTNRKRTRNENAKHPKSRKFDEITICKVCDERFDNMAESKSHIADRHPSDIYCQKCAKTFNSYNSFSVHLTNCNKYYKCNFCHYKNHRFYAVLLHENSRHTMRDSYICDCCKRVFYLKSSLKKHIVSHFDECQKYPCNICGVNFSKRTQLNYHVKWDHDKKVKRVSCHVCGKNYAAEKHLKVHLEQHDELHFLCTICGKVYTSSTGCRKHLREVHKIYTRKKIKK